MVFSYRKTNRTSHALLVEMLGGGAEEGYQLCWCLLKADAL